MWVVRATSRGIYVLTTAPLEYKHQNNEKKWNYKFPFLSSVAPIACPVVGHNLNGRQVQAPCYLYTILKVKIVEVARYLTFKIVSQS